MNYRKIPLLPMLLCISFMLYTMEQEYRRSIDLSSQPTLDTDKIPLAIAFIDAYINGKLNAHQDIVTFDGLSPTNSYRCTLNYANELLQLCMPPYNSLYYETDQLYELNILLLLDLDDEAQLDLQKKRLQYFNALTSFDCTKHFALVLQKKRDKDQFFCNKLEAQLGGTIEGITNHTIIEKIQIFNYNRLQLEKALKEQNANKINEACKKPLQLETLTLPEYIKKKCDYYKNRLDATSKKFSIK